MVSIDHFRQELSAQLGRAAAQNFADVLINSGELCRSLGGYLGSVRGMPTCCEAMEAEIMPGDIILVEKSSGAGMTVRYYLPRKLK
jgi:UDP-N-acetylmuramyl pentapeptide synthase